jgi:hypothetical protein
MAQFVEQTAVTSRSSPSDALSSSHALPHPIDNILFPAVSQDHSFNLGPIFMTESQDRGFTIFTKLPYELQNAVWTIAALEPRIVEVHSYTRRTRSAKGRKKTESRFLSGTPAPAILHTCSRSRNSGLKLYERLCFGDYFSGCYINWMCDFIKFEGSIKVVIAAAETTLANLVAKCRRLIIREFEFSLWSRIEKLRNIEEIVLLCEIEEPPQPHRKRQFGSLTLVPINDPRLSASTDDTSQHYRRKEQQLKTLMQVDDLNSFALAVSGRQRMPANIPFEYQQWFQYSDVASMIKPFQRARNDFKCISLMSAIRGKERAMTRGWKAEQKRKEKAQAQKEYRLNHPEIPWHEHGFQEDCPCIQCTGTGST